MNTFINPEIEDLWKSWKEMREEIRRTHGSTFKAKKYRDLMVKTWPILYEMLCVDDAEVNRDHILLYYEICGLFDSLLDGDGHIIVENYLCDDDYEWCLDDACYYAALFHLDLMDSFRNKTIGFDKKSYILVETTDEQALENKNYPWMKDKFFGWTVNPATFRLPKELPWLDM